MSTSKKTSDMLLARVVACNFGNSIYDTNDLSTIRGSSLIILRFPDQLIEGLKATHPGVLARTITSGASELLFEFEASSNAPETVEGYLREVLRDGSRHIGLPLSLFTFVWAIEKALPTQGEDFRQRLQVLIARCNYEQFQHPTIRVPEHYSDEMRSAAKQSTTAAGVVCNLDGIRPAHRTHKQKERPVSLSVYSRREEGRKAKKDFYEKELGDGSFAECDFAQDFSDFIDDPADNLELPESLKGKMALIYLDGNQFGKKRDRTYDDQGKLEIFSQELKDKRKVLLRDVLWSIVPIKEMLHPKDQNDLPRLRFETLLWGGDEVIWVLPAWHAWAFMGAVQQNLNDGKIWDGLTHAAGMLIAPYKAPIKDLTALVKDLGDKAKVNREINGVQIGVVTGFDLPGITADELRQPLFFPNYASGNVPHGAFQMNGAEWHDIVAGMAAIKDPKSGLPRSSLYRLYHEALKKGLFDPASAKDAKRHLNDGITRIREVNGDIDDDRLETLQNGFPGSNGIENHPLVPLHQILQLWDIAR